MLEAMMGHTPRLRVPAAPMPVHTIAMFIFLWTSPGPLIRMFAAGHKPPDCTPVVVGRRSQGET